MVGCSVKGCKNNSGRKDDRISFHTFPWNEEIKNKWIEATGRLNNWHPHKHSRICSAHFEEDCYIRGNKRILLFPSVCPTKLVHGDMNVLKKRMIPPIKEENIDWTAEASQAKNWKLTATANSIETLERKEILKLQSENLKLHSENLKLQSENLKLQSENLKLQSENLKLENKVKKEKDISAKRLRKLNAVRESRRRLAKKVATLENILSDLKCKGVINNEKAEVLTNTETENKDFFKIYLNEDFCKQEYSSDLEYNRIE